MAELSGPANCSNIFVTQRSSIQSNPDIGGIGVIISFLLGAYLPTIFIVVSYATGVVPIQLLSRADTDFFRVKFRRRTAWHKTLVKAILLFSDSQIVTGIAIMVSVLTRLSTTSVYHFRLALFLAWMASNTHLTTLVVLRKYLMGSNILRVWRALNMVILYLMLMFAMVPGIHWNWELLAKGASVTLDSGGPNATTLFYNINYPASCLFTPLHMDTIEPGVRDMLADPQVQATLFSVSNRLGYVFNIALVTGLYLLKWALMFRRLSYFVALIFKYYPLWLIERGLKACAGTAAKYATVRHNTGGRKFSRPAQVTRFARFRYRALVSIYTITICTLDFLQTFIANIMVLAWGSVWGSIQIYLASWGVGGQSTSENYWGFGQILPMMLLLLPIASVIDSLFGSRDKDIGQGTHHQLLMEEGTYSSTSTHSNSTTPTISRSNSRSHGPHELPAFTEADFLAPPRYQAIVSTPSRALSPMPRSPDPDRKIPVIDAPEPDWDLESPMESPLPADMTRFPMPPRGRSPAPPRGPSPAPVGRSTSTSTAATFDSEKRRGLLPPPNHHHHHHHHRSHSQDHTQPAPHQFLGGPKPPDMYVPMTEWFRTLETARPRLRDAKFATHADDARTIALHRFLYRTLWCRAVFVIHSLAMLASIITLILFGMLDTANPLASWQSFFTVIEIWLGLLFLWFLGGFFVKNDLYK